MARVTSLVASFPSPHSGTVDLGPLTIHMYGLMLLLAIAVCIVVTGIRWTRLGGDWDLVLRVAVWGVAFGVIGARAYHDITSWDEVPKHWWGFAAVWKGGLGVWGGILLGTLAGAWVVRRSGNSIRLFMDAVAPGLLLAQGIGRWGNWWNQELYGKPTSLPWKLHIDFAHAPQPPSKYSSDSYFHPTFLYEFVYDTIMAGVLIWVGSRFRIRPPGLFALYVSIYTFGRTFEELLRIDPSGHLLGERTNFWVSIVVFVCSTAFFVWWQFLRAPGPEVRIRAKPAAPPKGPTMAIPRGRIRSGR
jgi:phosphatidylglycerol---prolipoprotein diacylglyceryl transferase